MVIGLNQEKVKKNSYPDLLGGDPVMEFDFSPLLEAC
jgi:hypothetical protein